MTDFPLVIFHFSFVIGNSGAVPLPNLQITGAGAASGPFVFSSCDAVRMIGIHGCTISR